MQTRGITALVLAAALGACATTSETGAAAAPSDQQASIPFADFGAIRTWRAGPDDTLLLQGTQGRWYQATFIGICPDLRWAHTLGVISDATGSVNRFSGVIVGGRRCYFNSLVEVPDPDQQPARPSTP